MSVLLQRPHHIPGLITLNRQPPKSHVSSSPARQRQQFNRNTQPALDRSQPVAVPILSPKLNRKQHQRRPSVSVPTPTPAALPQQPSTEQATPKQARRRNKSGQSTPSPSPSPAPTATPRKAATLTAPSTPTPSPALPIPVARRPAKSPKSSARVPAAAAGVLQSAIEITDALPEWDSPPKESLVKESSKSAPSTPTPSAKRTRRAASPGQSSLPGTDSSPQAPINWQQASLFNAPTTAPALDTTSAGITSHSTPSSPIARTPAPSTPASTVPFNYGIGFYHNAVTSKRPTTHTRAPSYPTFPMHRQKDTFTSYGNQSSLESLFNLSFPSSGTIGHARGASTSLGSAGLHARMAEKEREREEKERRRKDAFAAFAGASFQTAPNAISVGIPSIFGRLTGLDDSASSEDDSDDASFDGGVIDLGDVDHEASKDVFPAFLM